MKCMKNSSCNNDFTPSFWTGADAMLEESLRSRCECSVVSEQLGTCDCTLPAYPRSAISVRHGFRGSFYICSVTFGPSQSPLPPLRRRRLQTQVAGFECHRCIKNFFFFKGFTYPECSDCAAKRLRQSQTLVCLLVTSTMEAIFPPLLIKAFVVVTECYI